MHLEALHLGAGRSGLVELARKTSTNSASGWKDAGYQPQGWGRACRFVALRYEKEPESNINTRVFVTNLAEIAAVVWFYNEPRKKDTNRNHFQLVMLVQPQSVAAAPWRRRGWLSFVAASERASV